VTAEIESQHNQRIPMDNGIAVFRYAGGPLAEVNCSFTCAAAENTTEIVCEKGTIVQNYGDAVSCNVPRPPGPPGLRWYSAAEEGRTSLRMTLATYVSSREGRRVRLDDAAIERA